MVDAEERVPEPYRFQPTEAKRYLVVVNSVAVVVGSIAVVVVGTFGYRVDSWGTTLGDIRT